MLFGIKRIDKIIDYDIVYRSVDRDKLTLHVKQRQLRFVGHCLRSDKDDYINKYVLRVPEERHGKTGRC